MRQYFHVRVGGYGVSIMAVFILSALVLAGQPLRVTVRQVPWESMTQRVPGFDDQVVTALGVADQQLYVAVGRRVFVYSDNGGPQDVTFRIPGEADDKVTSILVDAVRKELWIGTNGNTHSSLCYDYALRPGCASKAYLDEWVRFYGSLSSSRAPEPNSIETFDRDGPRAVVGFYKGNIYGYDVAKDLYRLFYRPSNPYNWALASGVRGRCAMAGTRGDGLIVMDLANEGAARYPDVSSDRYIRALAMDGREAFFGAKGLYRTPLAAFCEGK